MASFLHVLIRQESEEGSSEERAYEFDAALLPNLTFRVELVEPPNVRPLLVYTDAMFRPRKRKRTETATTMRWKHGKPDSSPSCMGIVLRSTSKSQH